MTHPAWCSLRLCEVTDDLPTHNAYHRSEPIALDAKGLTLPTGVVQGASAQLVQIVAPWSTSTFLVITTDDSQEISMRLHEAVTVLTQLTELAAAADS
jgi:hypothetical protein